LLAHGAAVTAELEPLHLALARSPAGPPRRLFGPEHGYYGVEQDMVASAGGRDPWTGVPLCSLYGDDEGSLRPSPDAFDGLDLLLVDLQDVGSRYYTYAATALWAAEAALAAGVEAWILDRPNPLGGRRVEGNLPLPGHESFVGAFRLPVRHGLTLGELARLEARRRGWDVAGLEVVAMEGWQRWMTWADAGRPWLAPSPNMPTHGTAVVYPGMCLLEATTVSEGRGTTRPFHLVGAPGIDGRRLAEDLNARRLPGVRFLPAFFRPQFQKHAGALCGGVEVVVTEPAAYPSYRAGVELLAALRRLEPERFAWRSEPYEFVADRPAIDLLSGGPTLRRILDAGADETDLAAWVAGWRADEEAFLDQRRAALLYPEDAG
ncbi:MAG: DUF1343 domain-containing protein, partial [Acidobacteria bacterium]